MSADEATGHCPGLNGGSCWAWSHGLSQESEFRPGFQVKSEKTAKFFENWMQLLNTPTFLGHWNFSNEKLRMKQPLEVKEMWFMPQEGESISLAEIWTHPISAHHCRPGLVPGKGTCQCSAQALGLINKKGKIYKSHPVENKSRIGFRAWIRAALPGYLL